ncbi:MAG: methyltransferase domain-containing protein [Acidimicrobiia bacterium]|nr:methyltransferase domain-containing protein [Acidimicrobiia bacterium]MYC57343.1 methyltransferase domain-containing protein [Acidimicrobiia bacterium]MYG94546.1 methyltransferase domain-containing protein [Acidimicrobiia bacterium]MYI30274.1 methyltransferase domain-containing protein [Acidimicrobiia bacterium]
MIGRSDLELAWDLSVSVDPRPVSMIGEPLLYADGVEPELLAVISGAADRRVGSDELAKAIRDWPTAYHLSPERAVLLAPLRIAPQDRVLDVGAGSGVNTRLCADWGAVVTALEGSVARAELIAHRCAGLDRVEVLCGPLDGLDLERHGAYDVVLVVGVLEYASTYVGGGDGPKALLNHVAAATAPDGVVVLAIENRLGLKYLLGFPEDHLGLPWVGLEGYRTGEPTTWSRRELAQMLAGAGLCVQKWMYPFPDYKLPSAVLAEEVYERLDGVDLVDQIVGHPTSSEFTQSVLLADDRDAHRTLVKAGLGPDVANSFLIVAGRYQSAVADRVDHKVLAWRVAPGRCQRWRQQAVVVNSDQGLIIKRKLMAPKQPKTLEEVAEPQGWLRQAVLAEDEYVAGRNLEQCLLDCARQDDANGVVEALRVWRTALAAHEKSIDSAAVAHPYLLADATRVLPPEWLDAAPDNFVVTPQGLKFVDREWLAVGGVDVRLAVVRGLWKTVSAMLAARCHMPWPVTWRNDRLVKHLGGLIGEEIDDDLMQQWHQAEEDLIRQVYCQPEVRLAELHDAGSRSRMDLLGSQLAPYRRMEHRMRRQEELIAELLEPHETAMALEQTQVKLEQAESRLTDVQAELQEVQARLARVAWRERIHNAVASVIRSQR